MRWVRLGVVALLTLALGSLFLTPVRDAVAKSATSSSASAKTPEEMAKQALEKWKSVLKITDEQAPQFEAAMTESYRKMAEAKTEAAGDKAKMKASMQSIMKERDEALAKVLTPEQMKVYHEKVDKAVAHGKKQMAKHTEATSK